MAERQYAGGSSPFPTRHRPSIFNRLPAEEFIDRRGEPVLWFRALPVPKKRSIGTLAMPSSHQENKGYILGFQKSFRIFEETIALQHHNKVKFRPAFVPIDKVHSLFVYRNELQGGNLPLEVISTDRTSFTIKENQNLKYWHELRLDYEVLLYEPKTVTFEKKNEGIILELKEDPLLITDISNENLINVCVGVNSICRMSDNTNIENYSFDFHRIYLPETESEVIDTYTLGLNIYAPITIAYSTLRAKKNNETTIPIQVGDLEAVISSYYPISEGDLLVMTSSQGQAKELCQKHTDGNFYLKYGPIVAIDKAYAESLGKSVEIDIETIKLKGFHSFCIDDPSISSLSVSYSYHPQYRVKEKLGFSALEGRRQPSKWRLSPEHTNLAF